MRDVVASGFSLKRNCPYEACRAADDTIFSLRLRRGLACGDPAPARARAVTVSRKQRRKYVDSERIYDPGSGKGTKCRPKTSRVAVDQWLREFTPPKPSAAIFSRKPTHFMRLYEECVGRGTLSAFSDARRRYGCWPRRCGPRSATTSSTVGDARAASSFTKFLASARNLRDGTERTLGEDETAASGQTLGRARCRPSGSTTAELDRVRWARAATGCNEAVMLCNIEGLPGDVNLTDG